ncbi:DoxX family membrane protein [Calidifontibacter sp. DB0510]|uniref:DoxX family membrane protein n=1 Tax=Metallococcus carri TaxID=1656884 RepID=A0A967AZ40_9MICO|nr:DoxX family membrane protein [Metallococcus carri]NHN55746.1 DoxX family membrane protein [Metallococcus carri]NOP38565.1 DoxX family membrane protein [Calidifontibacter sp. DB2511S]
MNPLRIPARMLTGSTYALLGYDAATNPGGRVQAAAPTLAAIRQVVPIPNDDELLVRVNGGVMAVGGTMIALGIRPRLAALAVAGALIPTTIAGHAFWKIEDPAQRKMQQTQFVKNMAMLGGLLYAVID